MSNPPSPFKLAAPAVKKLIGEQTVRERLVKRFKKKLKEVPNAPAITWATRRRLMVLLKDAEAEGFLMDQDDQGVDALSAMIASTVLRSDPSQDSLIIAQALMAEYPESLGLQEAFGGLYYKLRRLDESINSQFERELQSIDQSAQTASQIDPDILLTGPLHGLGLTDQQGRSARRRAARSPRQGRRRGRPRLVG